MIGTIAPAAIYLRRAQNYPPAIYRNSQPDLSRAVTLSGARKRDDGSPIPVTEQRRDLRWMPPIPVSITDLDALPSVIRPVRP